MKLFELFATLSLDTSGFDEGVEQAKKAAEDLGDGVEKGVTAKAVAMGNALYDAAKGAASVLWNLGQDAISAAAEIEAENAQFSATFRGMEEDATAAFGSIAEDTNVLAGRLRSVGMQAFSQFKGAGMEAGRALMTMDEYTRLAADAAAYYDISLEDADTRLRSFLRGNVEAGDAIGLFTSALQRDEKGLALYNAKWQDLNEEQRQLVMLDIAKEIYQQSGALGQAAREGDAYANVVGNFQRAWKEALATLGGPILQKITPAIERLTEFLQQNPETLEKIGSVFGDLAGVAVDSLIGGLEWLSQNGETILATFNNLLNTINNIIAALSGNYHTDVTAQVTMDVNTSVTTATGNAALGVAAGGVVQSSMMPDSPAGAAGQWLGNAISSLFGFGPKAVGMDYVPYDGPALLHEGEAVLTKAEATSWRRGENPANGQEIDYDRMAQAVANAMDGVSVNMDGRTVGQVVAPTVSKEIAQNSKARRHGR